MTVQDHSIALEVSRPARSQRVEEDGKAGDVVAWTDDYSDIIGAMLRKTLTR